MIESWQPDRCVRIDPFRMASETLLNINTIISKLMSEVGQKGCGQATTKIIEHPEQNWAVRMGPTTPSGSCTMRLTYKRALRLTLDEGGTFGRIQLEYNSAVRHWAAWVLDGAGQHQIHGDCRDNVIITTIGFHLSKQHTYHIAQQVMACFHRLRIEDYEMWYPNQIEYSEPEIHSGLDAPEEQSDFLAHAFQVQSFTISPGFEDHHTSPAALWHHTDMFFGGPPAIKVPSGEDERLPPRLTPFYRCHQKWYGQ